MQAKINHSGFALLEMVVVIGVLTLIMTTTLISFPNFRGGILISKEAAKLAQYARQAQSNALSVRKFEKADATFNDNPFCDLALVPSKFPPFGIGVASCGIGCSGDQRTPTRFLVFGDINCNKRYDEASLYGNEIIGSLVSLENGIYINAIRGCNGAICVNNRQMEIVYQRPDPSTTIFGNDFFGPPPGNTTGPYDIVEITLKSADDKYTKQVILRTTGQISIK